jgi:hypothetical protein
MLSIIGWKVKAISITEPALHLFSIVLVCIATSFISIKGQHDPIILHDEPFAFIPQKFYIINVADGRANRNVTAILFEKGKNSPIQVDLKDGAVHAIKIFLDHNLHRDTSLRPILLTIKEFQLKETCLSDGMVKGNLKVVFSFSSQLSYENKHLVDFNGSINYKRQFSNPINAETYLRQGIADGLTYFNNWIKIQRPSNAN